MLKISLASMPAQDGRLFFQQRVVAAFAKVRGDNLGGFRISLIVALQLPAPGAVEAYMWRANGEFGPELLTKRPPGTHKRTGEERIIDGTGI